ncbi:hypothetical protein [Arthrobacter sulfonylureivorans]|uniref:Uncharacterized protein n=1 Tax=Arthrobacter sulfonylureivorans TaxID=2486855 RepID=A0ABY3W6P3_9MICC|nr:hypothetical protein [Arthrobacter sulfonylureivorans]UNK45666.1 hypothetical protein MNQ99_17395 [Arthrobacter sulfonylureivorans]
MLDKNPSVSVARIVELRGDELRRASKGESPRYIAIPQAGASLFADLETVATVSKSALPHFEISHGLDPLNSVQIRTFARSIGRRYSRFAFPDEVVPWLAPLRGVITSKYSRQNSALGQVLQEIVELRVEANSWHQPHRQLILHVIVKAGTVPTLDEPRPISPEIASLLDNSLSPLTASDIASKIASAMQNPSSEERDDLYHLWLAFADALAAQCKLRPTDLDNPEYANAVADISAELSSDDEFTLNQYRRSEMLDLDYLSEPALS